MELDIESTCNISDDACTCEDCMRELDNSADGMTFHHQYYDAPLPYSGDADEGYTPDTIADDVDIMQTIRDACGR